MRVVDKDGADGRMRACGGHLRNMVIGTIISTIVQRNACVVIGRLAVLSGVSYRR